jgi:hypothetical protein
LLAKVDSSFFVKQAAVLALPVFGVLHQEEEDRDHAKDEPEKKPKPGAAGISRGLGRATNVVSGGTRINSGNRRS